MESWSKYAKLYDPIKCASIDGTDCDPHDRAVVRAMNATYKPNRFVKGRPECTIFVSRLNHETTKETIKEIFSKYGKLKRFRIIKDIVTGMSKGYAFVEYEEEQSAEEAYRLANRMLVDERHIFVDFECERLLKGWKPRRLGGGFGGKKESGQLRFGGRDRPFKKPIALEMKEKKEKRQREDEERRRRVKRKRNSSSSNKEKRKSLSKERKRPKSPAKEHHSRSKDRTKQSSETKPLRKKSPANSRGDPQSRTSRIDERQRSPPRQTNGRLNSPTHQRNQKRFSPYKGEEKRPRIDHKPIMHPRSRRDSPLMRSRSPISNRESNNYNKSQSPRENNYRCQSPIRDQNQCRTLYDDNDNSAYYLPPNVDFQHPPPAYHNSGPPKVEYNGETRRDLRQEDYRPRDQYFSPEESNYAPFRRNFDAAPVRGRSSRGRGGHLPYQRGGIRGGFQRY